MLTLWFGMVQRLQIYYHNTLLVSQLRHVACLKDIVNGLGVQAFVSKGVGVLHGVWMEVNQQLLFNHYP